MKSYATTAVRSLFVLTLFAVIGTRSVVECGFFECPARHPISYKARLVENTSFDYKCPIEGSTLSPYRGKDGTWWCNIDICPDGKAHDGGFCSTEPCWPAGIWCSGPCYKNDEGVGTVEMFYRINKR